MLRIQRWTVQRAPHAEAVHPVVSEGERRPRTQANPQIPGQWRGKKEEVDDGGICSTGTGAWNWTTRGA